MLTNAFVVVGIANSFSGTLSVLYEEIYHIWKILILLLASV